MFEQLKIDLQKASPHVKNVFHCGCSIDPTNGELKTSISVELDKWIIDPYLRIHGKPIEQDPENPDYNKAEANALFDVIHIFGYNLTKSTPEKNISFSFFCKS